MAPIGDGPESIRETELKFDVPTGYELPELARFAGSSGRVEVDTISLSSTYHDTVDGRLLRFHLTLRRRDAVGASDDVGWQLKVPGDGFRTELHWPADGNDQPPAAMTALLAPFLGGRPSRPAVRLEVTRNRHRVLDKSGKLRAEIAHDEVKAVELGTPVRAPHWVEVEVELGPAGDVARLARIGRALRKAGASASTSRSKLMRAVAGVGNESVGVPRESAGAVLAAYVTTQLDAMVAGYFAIAGEVDDSIHQTRVATRRLRSTLRTFHACYDGDAAAALGDELGWYAGVLGAARDLEVLRGRLADHLAELPAKSIMGQVSANIDNRLAQRLQAARAEVLAVHQSERYAQLLGRVLEWRDDPPTAAAAARPAETLTKSARRADRALLKRLEQATSRQGSDTDMHAARKAGKRARYASEVVRGGRSSDRVRHLQDLLGEFQDSVIASEAVNSLADEARRNGEDTFTYGVLFAAERARAEAARRKARRQA